MAAKEFTKLRLSQSTNGLNIKLTASASPGALIHTASSTDDDEIWLFAYNSGAGDQEVSVEWGGTTADDLLVETVPARVGLWPLIQGLQLTAGLLVRAFAVNANEVYIQGYVHRGTVVS